MKKPDRRIQQTVDAIAFARDATVRTATDGDVAGALRSFDESLHFGFFQSFRWSDLSREALLAVVRTIAENVPPDVLASMHAEAASDARWWRGHLRDIAYEIATGKPSKSDIGYYSPRGMA